MEQVITLQHLRIENFKGFRYLELDFGGHDATLYGDNAAGKTTVYDSLTWLLFGKDSRGQKDFDIKPLDSQGQVRDHAAITDVEAVLLCNGVSVCLRRTYYEKWSTKRGNAEKTFDGHSSDFYVDGVPCKKNEFENRVEALVPEDKFRLLTSVSFFPEVMNWQERRGVLFSLAGIRDDRDIMGTDARFTELLQALGNGTLEDYKKKLKAERAGYNTKRTDIPARISENEGRIRLLEELDFAALEAQNAELTAQKERVEENARQAGNGSLMDANKVKLRSLQNDLQKLELDNAAYRKSQEVPDERGHLTLRLAQMEREAQHHRRQVADLGAKMAELEGEIAECRQRWSDFNVRQFTGATCHTCGQALTGAALERAKSAFEAEVESGKARAILDSQHYKEQIEKYRLEQVRQVNTLQDVDREIGELKERLEALGTVEVPTVTDMLDYASRKLLLQEEVDAVNGQIFQLESDTAQQTAALRAQVRELDGKLQQVRVQLAKKHLLADLRQRVQELRQEAQKATDAMNRVDRMLFLCDEYTRYKVGFVEDTVNSLFLLAKFRLYREQTNGGVEDRCDVTYNGVPFSSLNNGARINVGLDIIRTLSREYGITVPLFVDNAESVTRLEHTGGQVIRLTVSEKDKELRCEYEN